MTVAAEHNAVAREAILFRCIVYNKHLHSRSKRDAPKQQF
jgi:hypothetical protein